MIRLKDADWERIREHFPEENIPDGRPGRKPVAPRRVFEAVLWILNCSDAGTRQCLAARCPATVLKIEERRTMMADNVPHNALVVVADGTGARFFRNTGHQGKILLSAEGEFKHTNFLDDGPAGMRPPESSHHETDEATFAKQLARELYRRAHSGNFAALVLIVDPQTLGQIRATLHKEVQDRLVLEVGKTLTKASIEDIQKALHTW